MKLNNEDPILVVGAGTSGLMAAWALSYYGFSEVHVLTREEEISWPEIPLQLSTQLLKLLNQLTLMGPFTETGAYWEQAGLKWNTDKVFHDIELGRLRTDTGFTPMTLTAPELREILLAKTAAEKIHYHRDFISFTQSEKEVQAHFLDGTSVTGGLLIGADGIDSRVRLQLLGNTEKQSHPLTTWRGVIPMVDLPVEVQEGLEAACIEYLGPGCRTTAFKMKDDRLGVEYTLLAPETPPNPEQLKELLKERFAEFPEKVLKLIEVLPVEKLVEEPHVDRDTAGKASEGRVVLIGQAAQPTLPYLGMETNLGMLEAWLLGRVIAEQPKRLDKAVAAFEKKRQPLIKRFHKAGRRYDSNINIENPAQYMLRNIVYPSLPESMTIGPFYEINCTDYYEGK